MAKLSTDDLLDAFKELTLIELSEFVKKFEETFEVTAAAPVAVAAGPAIIIAAGAAAVTSKVSSNCFTNSESSISVISLNASSSSSVLSFAMSGVLSWIL
jgi:large subunit ribosomal protein L7/L12